MRTVNWNEEERKARLMDIAALNYTVSDCLEARDASKDWNPENECYYQDLASVYSREIRRRKTVDK